MAHFKTNMHLDDVNGITEDRTEDKTEDITDDKTISKDKKYK